MPSAHRWIIARTINYVRWFDALRDRRARMAIDRRIDRLQGGNFGDSRFVGEGVNELRIDYGPGYRVYYATEDARIVLLLCGGDKSTQSRDIEKAKALAAMRGSR